MLLCGCLGVFNGCKSVAKWLMYGRISMIFACAECFFFPCCYAVARVFVVVTRVLLCGVFRVVISALYLLCGCWSVTNSCQGIVMWLLGCCSVFARALLNGC